MKQLNVLIEMCDHCPCSIVEAGSDNGEDPVKWENVCTKANSRVIEDPGIVPEWCPLEDAA